MSQSRRPKAERIEQLDLLMKPKPPRKGVEGLAITRLESDEDGNITHLTTEPDRGQPASEELDEEEEREAFFSHWAHHAP